MSLNTIFMHLRQFWKQLLQELAQQLSVKAVQMSPEPVSNPGFKTEAEDTCSNAHSQDSLLQEPRELCRHCVQPCGTPWAMKMVPGMATAGQIVKCWVSTYVSKIWVYANLVIQAPFIVNGERLGRLKWDESFCSADIFHLQRNLAQAD